MSDPSQDITTLESRVVYRNRWMSVREDRIRRQDGSEGIYGVVDKSDFAIIAPIDDGIVHLVQQYRYPIEKRQWEFPQGAWEDRPDADALAVARGELEEETGLVAGRMEQVAHLYPLYGTTSQGYRVFLACDLSPGKARREASEQDMVTRAFPLAEVEHMIVEGVIQDAGTVAAFGMLRLKGLV
jgi:ADP-ribose pyrophosphatase